MKIALLFLTLALGALSAAQNEVAVSVTGSVQLSVRRFAVIPVGTSRPGVTPSADELRKRWRVSFDVAIKNVGEHEIIVPTYFGSEEARMRSHTDRGATVDYVCEIHTEEGTTFVRSPVLYRFVTLRPGEAAQLPSYYVATEDPRTLPPHFFVLRITEQFGVRYGCWSGSVTVVSESKTPNQAPEPTTTAVTPRAP